MRHMPKTHAIELYLVFHLSPRRQHPFSVTFKIDISHTYLMLLSIKGNQSFQKIHVEFESESESNKTYDL